MLQWAISLIFRKRHYWRHASFGEVSELYVSRLLMTFATNSIGLFIALYLYTLGYSLQFIIMLYAVMFLLKLPFGFFAAKYIAHFGPKHGVLMANVLRVPSLIAMFAAPQYGIAAVLTFSLFQNMAATLYNVSYMVDFSKVRHELHTGKELATMQMIERFARVAAPLIGGILATLFGPAVVILVASLLFSISSYPLLRTIEPVPIRMKLKFRGFPWSLALGSFISSSAMGFDWTVSDMVWVLFTVFVVFSTLGGGVYAMLGLLFSIGVMVSMAAAWLFGVIVDKRKGDWLFTSGVIANSLIHVMRPFVTTVAAVVGVNAAKETATVAYSLPWTRAVFEVGDMSGYRVAYFMLLQMWSDIGSAIACVVAVGLIWTFGLVLGMQLFFVCAGMLELAMMAGRKYTK